MQPIFSDRNQALIVDWANLLGRSYAIQSDPVENWFELYAKMVLRLLTTYPNYVTLFALEGKGKKRRQKLYSEYKRGNRLKTGQVRPREIDQLAMAFVECLPCKLLRAEDGEADDAIASFLKEHSREHSRILILSEDRDLYQLIEDPIVAILNRKGQVLDEIGAFNNLGGLEPRSVAIFKCLMGDQSDNIKKVPLLGKKDALLLANGCTRLKELLKRLKTADLGSGKKAETIRSKDCKALLRMNYKLVKLDGSLPITIKRIKPKPKRLHRLLTSNGVYRWTQEELTNILRGQ